MSAKSITIKINTLVLFGILYMIFIAVIFTIILYSVAIQSRSNLSENKIYLPVEENKKDVKKEASHTGGAEITTKEASKNDNTNINEDEINKEDLPDYVFPILEDDYKFTSPYGRRISPITKTVKNHIGVDISSIWRARICSVDDGTVIDHWPPPDGYYKGHPIYGGLIKIEHKNNVVSVYAHLSESFVHIGDKIKKGSVIGRMGNTGKSDGDHLHFELIVDDNNVNPLLYFDINN